MMTKEDIEIRIRETIEDVTGKASIDKDKSLISRELGIYPVDFLYIFDRLEKKLHLPVFSIFEACSYDVMTIDGLTDALYDLNE